MNVLVLQSPCIVPFKKHGDFLTGSSTRERQTVEKADEKISLHSLVTEVVVIIIIIKE